MAISQPVLEPLREAERNLREALAYAARTEKAHVPAVISELVVRINTLIDMTEFFEDVAESIPKRY
jgi:hypothetical protein